MTPSESIELAWKEIDANTHHGVIPAQLAREIVGSLAKDIMDYVTHVVGRPNESD